MPIEIMNDSNVGRIFFSKEVSNDFKNSFCINYQCKVNVVEPNGHMRIKESTPATYLSWEGSHYYPTIGSSTSQHEVERVNIEDNVFIPIHFDSGNESK